MKRIPISGPWITDREISYVTDAVTNAWGENHGVYHQRFEKAFADYVGRKYAVSLPSCTSAIHLSLAALGIGAGDEVVVPDITWIGSAAPIDYVGATPVFADVDPDSWCISGHALESVITSRTKAVIPVDLYGNMAPMDDILRVAKKHGLAVVEDAAEACGAEYDGARAGSFGDIGVFSLHGSKTITTGEGGVLLTDSVDLYDRVQFLRDHGRAPGDRHFYQLEVAFKYKMSSMQAALGLAQVERLDEIIEKKRRIFEWYRDGLRDVPELTLNSEAANVKNTYWMVSVILDKTLGLEKMRCMELLYDQGIDTRPFFHPLSSLPAYAGRPEAKAAAERNKVAYDVSPRGINLPSGLMLDEQMVRRVCAAVVSIVDACRG